jgi:hypothetical protein
LAQGDVSRSRAARGATEAKGETVEQRIANLRRALKITSDQEPKWNAVAQAMRDNAIATDKLIAETGKRPARHDRGGRFEELPVTRTGACRWAE